MGVRILCSLVIGLVVLGAFSGCATRTISSEGLPNAQNPEFFGHPLRVIALPFDFAGNVLQYALVEPFYFLMNTAPEAVGLSLEEQRYLARRQEEWRKYMGGERKLVE
ncbi:MAG: hypothetical protein HY712_05825 [candidate division NC10 bacterium]|nr:hypothetical protein [candidate division NC10 bacterium]